MRHSNSGSRTIKDRLPVAGCRKQTRKAGGKGSSSAWNFNFNNGKENWNNRDNSNNNRAFAVRSRKRWLLFSPLKTYTELI